MADEGGGGGGFVGGLLLGLLAGTGLAMIAAPKTGEGTRHTLRTRADEVADAARDQAGDVGERLSGQTNELLERGRRIVERARARVDGAVAEGMDAATQQRNELQSRT